MKRPVDELPIIGVVMALLLGLILLLAACATPAPREVTVIKEVPVPYHQACPKPADVPAVPRRVAQDHPVMPTDANAVERILADKVLELFGYADKANGILAACSKP